MLISDSPFDLARTATTSETYPEGPLIPGKILGATAIICAAVLVAISVLGPLGTGTIQYRVSQSGIYQTQGVDLTNLILIAPVLIVAGVLELAGKGYARYLTILPPLTLFYLGLSYGMGEEYSNPSLPGNVQNFFWLYLILMIGGIILLVGAISSFTEQDAPRFNPRALRIYVVIMALFILVFAWMWVSQIMQVVNTGDLVDKSYSASPTAFWTVKYLDLGLTIPTGLIAMILLLSKPKRAYPLVLLFFGFFVTLVTSVNAMAAVQVVERDPALSSSASGLVVFPVLGALTYGGFFYLIKDKLRLRPNASKGT